MDLEKFDNHHVVDSTYNQPLIQPAKYRLTYDEYQQISLEEKLILKRNMYKKKVRFINKGLCVIINEEKFKDKVVISDQRKKLEDILRSFCTFPFMYVYSMSHDMDQPKILLF